MSLLLVDLEAIVERSAIARFLEETARFYGSRVTVADADGAAVAALNGGADEGDLACRLPVEVCGTRLGTVLASPVKPEDERAAVALATHVAGLVEELATREYELNDLSQEILDSYEQVNLFYGISSALGSVRDVEGVCRVILDKACEIIKVSRASILLLDDRTGDLRVAAARGISEEERRSIRIPVGEGISGQVLESRTPRLVDDVRNLPVGLLRNYEKYTTRSFVSVPLCLDPGASPEPTGAAAVRLEEGIVLPAERSRAIGVINMTDRTDRASFTSGDLKLLTALAGQAAVLIDNMRLIGIEKELKIARNIQQSLLPVAPPDVDGLELAGSCVPARNVGGDYFDFLVRPDGRQVFVVVADVSGHNLASALMMAVARTALRSQILESGAPGRSLERLNSFLYEDLTRSELFLSLLLMAYEPGRRRLRFANAGHNPSILYRPSEGGCRTLDAEGLLAGVIDDVPYPDEVVDLLPGDVVLLYTDGLVEAKGRDGEMFGIDRLARSLEENSERPAGPLLSRIFEDVYSFSGHRNQADDMTAVVLKVTEPGSR